MFRNNQLWLDLWVAYLIECIWREVSVRTSIVFPSADEMDTVLRFYACRAFESHVRDYDRTTRNFVDPPSTGFTTTELDLQVHFFIAEQV
jgi:hypothetical protein